MKDKTLSIVFPVGIACFILVIYFEFKRSREKREPFMENSQLYKTSCQTYRKCKREATRYANNKIENFKSSSKRLLRKWNF